MTVVPWPSRLVMRKAPPCSSTKAHGLNGGRVFTFALRGKQRRAQRPVIVHRQVHCAATIRRLLHPFDRVIATDALANGITKNSAQQAHDTGCRTDATRYVDLAACCRFRNAGRLAGLNGVH